MARRLFTAVVTVLLMFNSGCVALPSQDAPSTRLPATDLAISLPETPQTPNQFPFASYQMASGTFWLGNIENPEASIALFTSGKSEKLDVSVLEVSPSGRFLIYLDPNLGYSGDLKIAEAQAHQVQQTDVLAQQFLILSSSPKFVFAPDEQNSIATLLRTTPSSWDAVSIHSTSGVTNVVLREAEFLRSGIAARGDETLVPFGWRERNHLFFHSIRNNSDGYFGVRLWERDRDLWQSYTVTSPPILSNDGVFLAYVAYDQTKPGGASEGANVLKILDITRKKVSTISSTEDNTNRLDFPLLSLLAWSPDDKRLLFVGRGYQTATSGLGYVFYIADVILGTYSRVGFEKDQIVTDVKWTKTGILYLSHNDEISQVVRLNPDEPNISSELLGTTEGVWTRILKLW